MKKFIQIPLLVVLLFLALYPFFVSAQINNSGDNNGSDGPTPSSPVQYPAAPSSVAPSSATANNATSNQPLQYAPLEPLPGVDDNLTTTGGYFIGNLGTLAQGLFVLLIGAGAVFAVLALVIYGISYMTSDSVGMKMQARGRIRGAVIGLLLLLCSWIILHTINPALLNFAFLISPTSSSSSQASTNNGGVVVNGVVDANGDNNQAVYKAQQAWTECLDGVHMGTSFGECLTAHEPVINVGANEADLNRRNCNSLDPNNKGEFKMYPGINSISCASPNAIADEKQANKTKCAVLEYVAPVPAAFTGAAFTEAFLGEHPNDQTSLCYY